MSKITIKKHLTQNVNIDCRMRTDSPDYTNDFEETGRNLPQKRNQVTYQNLKPTPPKAKTLLTAA